MRNKTIRKGLLAFIIMLNTGIPFVQAQASGTSFWLAFGENSIVTGKDTGSFGTGFGTTLYFDIQIHSLHKVSGYIYFTHSGDSIPFRIQPGHVFSHRLTYNQAKCSYHDSLWKQDDRSIYIYSDSVVTVSAFSRKPYLSDATSVVPEEALGCDYFIFRQTGNHNPQQDEYCLVIASENNTFLNINNQPLCTLNRGETYYFTIPYTASGAGRKLHSNQPIALFNVEFVTAIPGFGILDKSFEQYLPVAASGKEFFVPVSDMRTDFVQVMATEHNTSITHSGGKLRTDISGPGRLNRLNAGEWIWIEISRGDSGCFISADKPVLVCSFFPSANFRDPFRISSGKGDPSIVWIMPVNRRVGSCIVKPFEILSSPNEMIPEYHAMIVVPSAGKNNITMRVNNGRSTSLSRGMWREHPSGWSYYDMFLDADSTYMFENKVHGLQVYSYCLSETESYYMLASAKYRNAKFSFTIDDTLCEKLSEIFFCEQEFTFRADVLDSLSRQPGHIRWFIDSVEDVSVRDQMVWKRYFPKGNYHIHLQVRYDDDFDTSTYHLSAMLNVVSLDVNTLITPECCHRSDGSIILSTNSIGPSTLIFELDSVGGYGDSIGGLKSGQYDLHVQDAWCEWRKQVWVDSVSGPIADFSASDTFAGRGMEILFENKSLSGGMGITSLHWDMGDGTYFFIPDVIHAYSEENVYNVRLTVSDGNHCADTAERLVHIVGHIFFPNVFAPESDYSANRYFRPMEKCGNYKSFDMTIYNRWGNEVWNQHCENGECPRQDDDAFWWDGTDSNGKPVSSGVYFWVVKTSYGHNGQTLFLKGSVTVFR